MNLTNQEKQERFRRKEALKKIADRIFRDWQLLNLGKFPKKPEDIRAELDRIADLPSGWSEDDYEQALISLQIYSNEIYSSNPHLLENDIVAGRDSICNPLMTDDPRQAIREQRDALAQAKKLVSHLNSAIELAGGTASDHAAVVLEIARSIGVALLREKNVPRSDATAICLLAANPQQNKPEWLIDVIAKILKQQLDGVKIKQLKEEL